MAKKTKSKLKYIHCDIYKRSVAIFFGELDDFLAELNSASENDAEHNEEVVNSIKELYEERTLTNACCMSYEGDIYIYAKKKPSLGVMVHESGHATMFILDIVGINAHESTEAYAYLLEYLFNGYMDLNKNI